MPRPADCEKYGNGCADLHVLLSAFADYLVTNAGLLRLFLCNGVFQLLYDSFRTSIDDWRHAQAGARKGSAYRASFVAAGLTGIARAYVEEGCVANREELEQTIRGLFGNCA